MNSWQYQTVARQSLLTRLDIRSKLVLVGVICITAFLWESPLLSALLAGAMFITCVAAGIRLAYLRMVLLLMTPFFLFMLLIHGFFNVEYVQTLTQQTSLSPLLTVPETWWFIGGRSLSREGLLYGIRIIGATLTLVLVLPPVIFTTDVNSLIVGLVQARVPYRFAFIFSSTLRFVPLLFAEMQLIIEAQRLRGLAVEELNILQRVQVYARVAVPLILNALVRSQHIELALQARAFSGSPQRTYLHESFLHRRDCVCISAALLFLLLVLTGYIGYGIGTFAGPL